jgi:hypothetical protein
MPKIETSELSAQFINQNFVRKLEEGRTKEAADEGSRFIRSKMRQDSFAREILEPVELGPDEIDRDENTDQPKKIIEKEPDSTATFATFKGTGQRTFFKGPRYSVPFGKVESQHFTKSKFELLTYQNDIRKILTDNSVKDMAEQEDQKFMDLVNAAIGVSSNSANGGADFNGAGHIKQGIQMLLNKQIPCGKILMSKHLYYEILDWTQTTFGDTVAGRHYDDGIEGEKTLFGFPVITTIRRDMLKVNNDDAMYFFAPENYLGNFFLLQDATLFIKQEADMIEFWSYSAPGIGIGNTNAVARVIVKD